jgi:hypothetical protein
MPTCPSSAQRNSAVVTIAIPVVGEERGAAVITSKVILRFVGERAAVRLAERGTISPAAVRFSQDSIRGTFRDGGSVKQLTADLRSGAVDAASIPPIRLLERDGKIYTLDNRRLAAFQEAGVNVPYRMATPQEIAREQGKFTTTNDGSSITIRGGG